MNLEELFSTLEATLSPAEKLARLPVPERNRILSDLTPGELEALRESWAFWGRPNQRPPDADCPCCLGEWINWLILAGRGWGKTRTGAEWVHEKVNSGAYKRIYIVGATIEDAEKIQVRGESGLLATQKSANPCEYSPTTQTMKWKNGAIGNVFGATNEEAFRGHQGDAAWLDELAAWTDMGCWSQIQLGLRLGANPRSIITTTPRPKPIIRRLIKEATTHVTEGSTYENLNNLAPAFVQEIISAFEGTRFGRQEIYAKMLDDSEFALWTRQILDDTRVDRMEAPKPSDCKKLVIGVDPAVSMTTESDETGIVVAGIDGRGHAYVYKDASGRMRVEDWAARACELYHLYGADMIVAEKNQGGDLVEHTIKMADPTVTVKGVPASKSKVTRAEPIALAFEKGKAHMVGTFETLEEQLCTWEQGDRESPDRLDAMVWALTELVGAPKIISSVRMIGNELGLDDPWWR